jgi:hypothetical protein
MIARRSRCICCAGRGRKAVKNPGMFRCITLGINLALGACEHAVVSQFEIYRRIMGRMISQTLALKMRPCLAACSLVDAA